MERGCSVSKWLEVGGGSPEKDCVRKISLNGYVQNSWAKESREKFVEKCAGECTLCPSFMKNQGINVYVGMNTSDC
jgi:hypothetical protein